MAEDRIYSFEPSFIPSR